MGVVIGLDVGQRSEPTAIAVAEAVERERPDGQGRETHHVVRFLERLPLGTPYPAVAARAAAVAAGVAGRTGRRPRLYANATGLGTPLLDVLRAAEVRAFLRIVYFTWGDRRFADDPEVTLGKAWLVSRMQTLLQAGCLHLPPGHPDARLLTRCKTSRRPGPCA